MVRVVLWRVRAFERVLEDVKVDCLGAAGAGMRARLGSPEDAKRTMSSSGSKKNLEISLTSGCNGLHMFGSSWSDLTLLSEESWWQSLGISVFIFNFDREL